MLLRNNDGLSRNERRAFKMLADTLIFNKPLEYELSKKNIPLIVQKLRSEMIDLDTRSQRALSLHVDETFKNLTIMSDGIEEKDWRPRTLDKTDFDLNLYLRELETTKKCKERTFLFGFTQSYSCVCPLYEQYKYGKWGFTPRLAEFSLKAETEFGSKWDIRKNCFGTTIGLASYFKMRGLRFELAITADHPYLIVYLSDGQKFAVSNSMPKRLHGKIVRKNGYGIYKPHKKDGLPHHVMLLYDFDTCVVYEILENMEMLRLISLGINETRLPDTYEEGLEIADAHKEILQKNNWKLLASKLFPEITESILENIDDWKKELDQMIPIRKRQHAENVFFLATKEALKETEYSNLDYREGQNTFFVEMRSWRFRDDILNFLREDKAFTDPFMLSKWRAYFSVFKEIIKKQTLEIREVCIELIEKKLFQKSKLKTRNHDKVRKHHTIHILRTQNSRGKENRRRKTSSSLS